MVVVVVVIVVVVVVVAVVAVAAAGELLFIDCCCCGCHDRCRCGHRRHCRRDCSASCWWFPFSGICYCTSFLVDNVLVLITGGDTRQGGVGTRTMLHLALRTVAWLARKHPESLSKSPGMKTFSLNSSS